MAYQVYAGLVKFDDQTGGWVWTSKNLIFASDNPMQNTPVILEPRLSQEKNQIGSFTFTIPKALQDARGAYLENPIYSTVRENSTIVAIYQDGTLYWIGFVTSVILNFDLSKDVTVADVLEFLKWDSTFIRPSTYYVTREKDIDITNNLWDNFTSLGHTRYIDGCVLWPPMFWMGNVDVQRGVTKDFSSNGTDVSVCWDAINTYWLDEYDGYFRPRYVETSSGITFYLDYTVDISAKTEQTVKYGVNMLDLKYDRTVPSDLVNCVYASGFATVTKGWWIFKTTSQQYIDGAAENVASCKKHGMHARRIVDDTATSNEALCAVCEKELATCKQDYEPTISVKAFDLCDAGLATDHLGFLKKTHIISKPHGIDEWMVCTKVSIPLDQPDQKEFTFGRPPEKLTKQQNKNTTASKQAKLTLRGLIRHAQG